MRVLLLLGLFLLGGCVTPYTLIEPQSVPVKATFNVTPARSWNKINTNRQEPLEIWTLNGAQLDLLTFVTGVADGQPLYKREQQKEPLAPYRAGMSPTEIMEWFEASVAAVNNTTLIVAKDLQPARLAGHDGFRFELAFTSQQNLDQRGLVVATVKDGRFYAVYFSGTRLYHYPAALPEVRQIIDSIRLL